jgi:predicted MFS family arabinose efflux permease
VRTRYFYGYNIVAAGFIIQAVGVGAMFTYGVFFKEFQAEFGWSRAAISGASSLAFLMMGLVGVLAGKMNDRIGPKAIIVASGISLGIGYLLMSRLQALWQLYLIYGVLVGIGFSTHDVITLSTVARWFIRRRGMMSGIVKVGTGSGQFLVPLIATLLIAAYGWRNSYFIIGAVALVIFVAVAQVLSRDPQGIGLLPDGDSSESYDNGNRSRQERCDPEGGRPNPAVLDHMHCRVRHLLLPADRHCAYRPTRYGPAISSANRCGCPFDDRRDKHAGSDCDRHGQRQNRRKTLIGHLFHLVALWSFLAECGQ